ASYMATSAAPTCFSARMARGMTCCLFLSILDLLSWQAMLPSLLTPRPKTIFSCLTHLKASASMH
ncbi:hypothetical protein GGF49_006131, partial [Coemansia sp. RSA 1853]